MRETQHSVPCLLDKVINDVGCGAIIKNTETDRKAIIIDVGLENPMVCMYKGDEDENKEPQFTSNDYCVKELLDTRQWIVLTNGRNDIVLVD